MAREMALAGVDRSELTPPPPVKKPDTFKEKWENYWYHYKWITWVVSALILIAAWFLYQQIIKDPADYAVVVVTEQPLLPQETDALCALLASSGEDLDGDGKVEVTIENLNPSFYDQTAPTVGRSDMQKLISYLSTGDRMLFVFDQVSYDGFSETVREATGEEYSFFVSLDTKDASYHEEEHYWSWRADARRLDAAFAELPTELYFGVRAPSGTADKSSARRLSEEGAALMYRLMETAQPIL